MHVNREDFWHIVYNTHAGSGEAVELVSELRRLLGKNDVQSSVHETISSDDGLRMARLIVRKSGLPLKRIIIAVVGGDGTLHDLINGIMHLEADATTRGVRFVLVPAGTANAIYHSFFPESNENPTNFDRFLSAKEALKNPASLTPLSVCRVFTEVDAKPVYSHVVTSTCLHADILQTSSTPSWREKYPGIDRFKRAAEHHLGTAYSARITLHPIASHPTGVQRYLTKSEMWTDVSSGGITFSGNFAYFVSAVVDRFEPTFRIAPFSAPSQGRPAEAVDIVLVRYKEDASKQENAERLVKVLMAAYKDGEHIYLTETINGEEVPLVEYYRTGGFEWTPSNNAARLICIDGVTTKLPEGGMLKSEVVLQGGSGSDVNAFALFC